MAVCSSITETIGDTPLVRLNRVCPSGSHIYVKIEGKNPSGSVKDRAALSMVNDAAARGLLPEGGTIIEPTSGNTGISLAMIAAARDYRAIIVMPDTMSEDCISLMRAYGAEVVLSPGVQGMQGAVNVAKRIHQKKGGFIVRQFDNPANIAAHRTGTGPEILKDLPDVDYVFAGIGTGGTATGIALSFKDAGSDAKVIGVKPAESPLITNGRAEPHRIQSLGANFVPGNYHRDAVDGVIIIPDNDAVAMSVRLAREEGIFAGIFAGANVLAAINKAREEPSARIVAVLPDGGNKYTSLGIYE